LRIRQAIEALSRKEKGESSDFSTKKFSLEKEEGRPGKSRSDGEKKEILVSSVVPWRVRGRVEKKKNRGLEKEEGEGESLSLRGSNQT